jgi:hypothetical protein
MFIQRPASESAISRRKPLYGVGINDAPYITRPTINGVVEICPFFLTWRNMIERCYSVKTQERQPTYKGCSVVDQWHSFMEFRGWMEEHDWQDRALDKDIIVYGNKVYGPDTCCFVTREVNSLLFDNKGIRGKYPQGVSFNKPTNKLIANISISGKKVYLGLFDTIEEASEVYLMAKISHILKLAAAQDDERVNQGLKRYAVSMMDFS